MNATALAAPLLALAVLAPSASGPAAEPVTLAWRLAEGERFLVTAETAMETSTITMDQEQLQSTENRTVRLVTVEEVDDAGNMHLAITMQALNMVQGSEAMDLELDAERDENGDVTVLATVTSANPVIDEAELEGFFEAFGEALLEVTFEMTVTPQGRVLKAAIDGDPFANLPADGPVLEMTMKTLEILFSAEDLAAIAAGEMFVQLSPEAVEPGGEWDVAREMNVAGLGLSGTGTMRFESLEGEGDDAVALLVEETDYEIDTAGMSEKMDELMQSIFESMEMEMETSTDLTGEDFSVEASVRFDVAGGFPRSIEWEEQVIQVDGTMQVGPQEMELEVETRVSNSVAVWERVEVEEEEED